MAHLLANNRFLAFTAIICLLLGLNAWGYVFSWFAFFFIFLILHNTRNQSWGFLRFLGWSALVGFVYYLFALTWMISYHPYVLFFPLIVALLGFISFFMILYGVLRPVPHVIWDPLFAGALWALIGWGYEQTPVSGVLFQMPFYGPGIFLQIASLMGYGVLTGILVGLTWSLAAFMKTRIWANARMVLVFVLLVLAVATWGTTRLAVKQSPDLKFAIVQHNFPVGYFSKSSRKDEAREKSVALAKEAVKSNPAIIVFPQYTFPWLTQRNPGFYKDVAFATRKTILFASRVPYDPQARPRFHTASEQHITAGFLLDPAGNILNMYRAIQAPFTEEGVELGETYETVQTPFVRIGLLLCYEDIFPAMAKMAVDAGAQCLVSLSNTWHFRETALPERQLFQDRLRAIESDRYMIRSSPNGYSAVIDPAGRILSKTRRNEAGVLSVSVARKETMTPYHRLFSTIPWIYVLFMIPALVLWIRGLWRSLMQKRGVSILRESR